MKHTYLSILDSIKEKYGDQLNPELISLKIVQSKKNCWLHSEYQDEPNVVFIKNMNIIADDDLIPLPESISASFFNPLLDIEENAWRFIELDAYSLAMCFDRLIRKDIF